MRKSTNRWVLLVVALLSVLPFAPAPVRAADDPLLMTYKGDIWAWDGSAVKSRTQWGYNFIPVLSPDGKTIAYKSTAAVAVNAFKTFGNPGAAGELPSTIWLIDVATNKATRIADQPANASIFDPNQPDNYIIRSDPTWAADGSAVAWTELPITAGSVPDYRLIRYTIATKATNVLVPALPKSDNYEGYASLPVRWAEPGLAVMLRHIQMPNMSISVALYTEDGQYLTTSPNLPNIRDIEWVIDGAQVLLAVIPQPDANVPWLLISPKGGSPTPMKGSPELFSLTAPDGMTIFASNTFMQATWKFASKSSGVSGNLGNLGSPVDVKYLLAISPDGTRIAYPGNQSVSVTDGKISFVPVTNQFIAGLAWGPTRWRVRKGNSGG